MRVVLKKIGFHLGPKTTRFSVGCVLLLQTVSHELEEEALQREADVEKQMKALAAAAAAKERKKMEELSAKDQQISELQVLHCP